jgi:hypothetical protein
VTPALVVDGAGVEDVVPDEIIRRMSEFAEAG